MSGTLSFLYSAGYSSPLKALRELVTLDLGFDEEDAVEVRMRSRPTRRQARSTAIEPSNGIQIETGLGACASEA